MTLGRFGDIKADEHKAAHEKAIVRLGLEKASLESDVEQKRRELKSIVTSCELTRAELERANENLVEGVRQEVREKTEQLRAFDEKVEREEKEIELLAVKRQQLASDVASGESRLRGIEDEIARAEELKAAAQGDANKLLSLKSAKERDAAVALQETSKARKELEDALTAVSDAQKVKVAIDAEVDASRRALEELNEIISMLQSVNKQGLDLVASFDGERKRLDDKHMMLESVKHDLLIYIKRLQKAREEAGIKTPMVFPPGLLN